MLNTSTYNSKSLVATKGIAARATLSGFSQKSAYQPDKKATKFIVTLKPVQRQQDNETLALAPPPADPCRCEGRVSTTHGRLQVKAEDAMRGKTILNAFRLLANSKFITIDQNYVRPERGIVAPTPIQNTQPQPRPPQSQPQPVVATKKRMTGGSDATPRDGTCHCPQPKPKKKHSILPACLCPKKKPATEVKTADKGSDSPRFQCCRRNQRTKVEPETKSPAKPQTQAKTGTKQRNGCCVSCVAPQREPRSQPYQPTPGPQCPPPSQPQCHPQCHPQPQCPPQSHCSPQCDVHSKTVHEICKPRELRHDSDANRSSELGTLAIQGCSRIGNLEKAVEDMRLELGRIRCELVPQQEALRYSALAARLQELDSVLNELKSNCPMRPSVESSVQSEEKSEEKIERLEYYEEPVEKTVGRMTSESETQTLAPDELRGEVEEHQCNCAARRARREREAMKEREAMREREAMKERESMREQESWKDLEKEPEMEPEPEKEPEPVPECEPPRETAMRGDSSSSLLMRRSRTSRPSPMKERKPSRKSAACVCRQRSKHNLEPEKPPPVVVSDVSSHCLYCDNEEVPIIQNKLLDAVLQLIARRNPNDVALTIILQPDELYHINVAEIRSGESVGCLYVTEAGIQEASVEHLFEEFLTFFIVDARNTLEQKNKILNHTFEFITTDQRK